MKKTVIILLVASLLLGLLAACGQPKGAQTSPQTDTALEQPVMSFASSYEEVYTALTAAKEYNDARNQNQALTDGVVSDSQGSNPSENDGKGDGTIYSGTNVQVEGVDEGDIVKTDGTYFYILRECELIIMQADGETVTDLSHTMVGSAWEEQTAADGTSSGSEKYPQELYIVGDRLAVLSTYYDWTRTSDAAAGSEPGDNYMVVDLYDVSDRAAPQLVKSLGQDGYRVASRMIGNVLYLCTSYYAAGAQDGKPETYVPRLYDDGAAAAVDCGTIGLLPYEDSMTYSVLASYDVAAGETLSSQSVLGGGETVYMNAENLYLSRSVYNDGAGEPYQEDSYTVTDYHTSVSTTVSRFSVADGKLTYAATGAVPGALNNQFSMDEYDGHLRMVTTERTSSYSLYVDEARDFTNYDWKDDETTRNDVFVLDDALKTVGSITDLAPDEQVKAARFDGEYGYVCTYRTTDPVFALDLSNSDSPEVAGALKLQGYSDYLHVWGDGLLFGLGMNTQEVQTADGATAKVDGMKMVMMDSADPAKLSEKHTMSIDADYSEALFNHKAILADSGKNLIAFPAEGSYLVYSYDADTGFKLEAELSVSEWDMNNRGVYIGDYFYVIGSDCVNILDMATLENVGQTIISKG